MPVPPDPHVRARGEVPDDAPARAVVIEGPRQLFAIVTPDLTRTFTHYDGYRNRECTRRGGTGVCVGCSRHEVLNIRDWLQVIDPTSGQLVPRMLALTTFASEKAEPFDLWEYQGDLAGRLLWVWKVPPRMHGAMHCKLVPNDHKDYALVPATLPPYQPTIVVLRRMWAARSRRLPGPTGANGQVPRQDDAPPDGGTRHEV